MGILHLFHLAIAVGPGGDMRQSPRQVPGCCHYAASNREPSPTPMQGSNPTIYAVVLGIMRSLVEMHVSGAVNHPDQKGLQKLSIMEILQHDAHDPKAQRCHFPTSPIAVVHPP